MRFIYCNNFNNFRRWCWINCDFFSCFVTLAASLTLPAHFFFLSLLECLGTWYGAFGGGRKRSILVSAAQRTSLPVTPGQVSAGRRGSRHAETEKESESERTRGWGRGGGRGGRKSPLHGSQASKRVSGLAQGSAPPVDKRSILSISLSAPDNKQKFSKPRSCLVFEMCILVCYTHAAANLNSLTSGTEKQNTQCSHVWIERALP